MSYLAKNYNRKKISFKYGKGSYLYSNNNKKYLDFVQGIAVNSLGHANPNLIKAINKQSKKTIPYEIFNIGNGAPKKLLDYLKYIEKNFDYVGKDLSKKVREIYYDKKNNKAIYGTASQKEGEELAEEGIDLISIPWVNKDN